ncbi:MAG: phosphatase PAP2 family protein [Patescibacteria group bacterium]
MRNKINILLILIFGFFVTGLLVSGRRFVEFDLLATKSLQNIFPRFFDFPFSVFSLLGSSEIIGLLILAIAAAVYFKYQKIFWGLGAIVFIYIIELLGKFFLYHPGPPEEFFRYSIPFFFPSGGFVHTNYSFPSGHVSRTLFLVIILIFLIRKKWAYITGALFALIMIISRVYLGEHWLSDTVGGAFLGSSIGLLAVMFL